MYTRIYAEPSNQISKACRAAWSTFGSPFGFDTIHRSLSGMGYRHLVDPRFFNCNRNHSAITVAVEELCSTFCVLLGFLLFILAAHGFT